MTYSSVEQVYRLLPSIYRLRDHDQGGILEALLSVVAREVGIVEADVARLYENWFIETCDEWVVPYIGDLLGVRGLHPVSASTYSRRAFVANTLAYRRRKGTATMLEQLARDVTGWPARAVEFFQLLATTQYMNHIRLHNRSTVDFRDMDALERLGGPFERAAHSADVRRIAAPWPRTRGKYNIPNIGLFFWRLQSYPVTQASARKVDAGCFTFNPFGLDTPLFNLPRTEIEVTHLAEEINVPGELRRRALYGELEAFRQAIADGAHDQRRYFGEMPVLSVYLEDNKDPVPAQKIVICHLADWRTPPAVLKYEKQDGTSVSLPIDVAVDPILGRLRLGSGVTPGKVRVSYSYGSSGDYGGGPYDRADSVAEWYDPFVRAATWQKGVVQDPGLHASDTSHLVMSLKDAVDAWTAHVANNPGAFGVIAVMDSRTYVGDLVDGQKIQIPAGSRLAIVAADWPLVPAAGAGQKRIMGQFVPQGLRPVIRGDMSVVGTAASSSDDRGELIVDGLWIQGKLTILEGNLGRLRVAHSTLMPTSGGLTCEKANGALEIHISRCIGGPVDLAKTVPSLILNGCLIDGQGKPAVKAPGTAVKLDRCTVVGSATARSLEASEVIATDLVVAERRQIGCIRFSFIPNGSKTPRRYRCQPELEIEEQIEAAQKKLQGNLTDAQKQEIRTRIIGWLTPAFSSLRFGDPAYGQLDRSCPVQIFQGAEDGAEMGVFHDLFQPQKEANLRASLDEYLRAGLQAGIFYVS